MSKFSLVFKILPLPALVATLIIMAACDERHWNHHHDDQPRNISVEVYACTTDIIEVYVGNSFSVSLEPGSWQTFYKDLYEDEVLVLRIKVYGPNGIRENVRYFDDEYSNYHWDVYDDHDHIF
jgi:hypothetical protein